MLTLFKPKILLKDLIPDNFVDIHCHLLPKIDDGAQSMEDTTLMISDLQKIGFEQFIATPHVMRTVWDNTSNEITNKLNATINTLKDSKILAPIKAAAEYLIDANFVTLFQNECLLVLKENYVLVEISYINAPLQLYEILFELQVAGYRPVLAHPERYTYYHNNFNEYLKLKNSGCLFQLNLLSTIGYYGLEVAKNSEKLLKKGMFDFVGSDVHHHKHIDSFSKKILVKDTQPLKEAIKNNQFFRF